MLNYYEINLSTNIIISFNGSISKVYEDGHELMIKNFSFDIVKNSCLFFGSSYEGRAYYTSSMLGFKMKLPIIIEESNPVIFFPTCSPKKNSCIWISYNNLLKYCKKNNNVTTLYFKDGSLVDINVNYNIIDNQIIRCIKLDSVWKLRKKEI